MTAESATAPDPAELVRRWASSTPGDWDEVVRQSARPAGTTGRIGQREGWIYVWEDGLCVSVTIYPEQDIDKARADAEQLARERR